MVDNNSAVSITVFTVEVHPSIAVWDAHGELHSVEMQVYVRKLYRSWPDPFPPITRTAHFWIGLDSVELNGDGTFTRARDGQRLWQAGPRVLTGFSDAYAHGVWPAPVTPARYKQ